MKILKNKFSWLFSVVLAFYIISYGIMSQRGHYEPEQFGLVTGLNGEAIMAPKLALSPYSWQPFELERSNGNMTFLSVFYYPLIIIDRKWFHTTNLAETGEYRVVDYFDWKKMEYRDIMPK